MGNAKSSQNPGTVSKRRNLLLFFVASLLVALLLVFAPVTIRYISSTANWNMAKSKWDQAAITHYRYSLFLSLPQCGVAAGGYTEVIDGHSNYVRCIGGEDTVERLFEIAHQCAFDFWNTCQVNYDPNYGYPTIPGIIEIRRFQPLP